jgi:hypothetical protein
MSFQNVTVTVIVSILSISCFASNGRKLVTTAVGQIKENFITSRQVNMSYFVETVLYSSKNKKIPDSFYSLQSKEFSREVTAVLLEEVVNMDSIDIEAMRPLESEITEAKNKFNSMAGKNPLWIQLSVNDGELTELIRKKLRSKKYIRFKVDSSVVPITDDEAKAYFEENRIKFGNLPFENFKQNIRAYLGRQQIDKRLKDWFEILQSKYKVKNLILDAEA